jgi:hypothetical protein
MQARVRALVGQPQARLAEKDCRITALTHELAYLKNQASSKPARQRASHQSPGVAGRKAAH